MLTYSTIYSLNCNRKVCHRIMSQNTALDLDDEDEEDEEEYDQIRKYFVDTVYIFTYCARIAYCLPN